MKIDKGWFVLAGLNFGLGFYNLILSLKGSDIFNFIFNFLLGLFFLALAGYSVASGLEG